MVAERVERLEAAHLPTTPRRFLFMALAALTLGTLLLAGQYWILFWTNSQGIGGSGSAGLGATSGGIDLMEMWEGPGGQTPVRAGGRVEQAQTAAETPPGRHVARTIHMSLTVADLDAFRVGVESLVNDVNGSIVSVATYQDPSEPRTLTASLHVPFSGSDAALARLHGLGRVVAEEQRATDVSVRVVDLDARVRNLRTSEARLRLLLEKRTGTLADVLAAERELTRVTGQLEAMEASSRLLSQQTTFASLELRVREERTAALNMGASSVRRRLRNAAVDGGSMASHAAIGTLLLIVRLGPTVLSFGLVILPIWRLWRAARRRELLVPE